MKAFKNLNLAEKLGKSSWGGASATLRKMPMWQRIVSAIVAFLLVFLLWPADAAKTITAWANDTEAAQTTEEGVTDPDPESPDPGGGGEESDDPEVDPEIDPEIEPEAEPEESAGSETSAESFDQEKDENANFLDASNPVPNLTEVCGPFEWDFSAYVNNNRSLTAVTTTPLQTLDYADNSKIADLQFVGPWKSNNDVYDGGASAITENGFVSNYYHRLKGMSWKTADGEIVSNYLVFQPKANIESLEISCQAVDVYTKYGYKEYPIIGFLEVDPSATQFFSANAVTTNNITSSETWTKVKWDNNGKGFSYDKKYIIFFKPNVDYDSDYADYGGIKINHIKAEAQTGSLKVNVSDTADDTLIFQLFDIPDASSPLKFRLAREVEFDTSLEEGEGEVTLNMLPATSYQHWKLISKRTGVYKEHRVRTDPVVINPDETTELDLSLEYPKIEADIFNKYVGTGETTIHNIFATYEEDSGAIRNMNLLVDIEHGQSGNIVIDKVTSSGVLTLKAGLENASVYSIYCDVVRNSKIVTDLVDAGHYEVINAGLTSTHNITLSALCYGDDESLEQPVSIVTCDVLVLVPSTSGGYFQKQVHESGRGQHDVIYKVNDGDLLRVIPKPYGLWIKNKDGGQPINLNKYEVHSDLRAQIQLPSYSDFEKSADGKNYSITANYFAYNEITQQMVDKSVTISTVSKTDDGYIKRTITQRASDGVTGLEDLEANFSAVEYYSTQYQYDCEVEALSGPHVCEYGTFETSLKGEYDKLPVPAKNESATYYLDGDVYVKDMATIQKGSTVSLCLNGYALIMQKDSYLDVLTGDNSFNASRTKTFYNNKGTLNIYDCQKGKESCRHYFNRSSDGTWVLSSEWGMFSVDGGVITGAQKSAIYNEGTLNCEGASFIGNTNAYKSSNFGEGSGGGAIRSGTTSSGYYPTLNLKSCLFEGNTSQGAGGAVLVGVSNSDCTSGTATIDNCRFEFNGLIGETSSTTGYNHCWGGGALATFSMSGNDPVLYIKNNSEFYNNTSTFRGGAILLFHGTKCYMSDTTVQNNISGLYARTHSTTFNYAGGINLYTGFGNENSNPAFLYLSGKIICTENHSTTTNGERVEDNLCLQVQNLATKGYINFEQNKLLDPESVIGVNYIDNHNLDISKGYGASYIPAAEKNDPTVKYFILDEVAGRLSYALLIDIDSGELWIVKHTHKLTYTNDTSIKLFDNLDNNSGYGIQMSPRPDLLKVKCSAGTTQVSGHTFSKCKYEKNECTMYLHSEDDSSTYILGQYIPYDGEQHGVVCDFKNEFEGIIDEKPIDYDARTNVDGIIYLDADNNILSDVPSEPGIYCAAIRYYDVQISNGQKVVNTNIVHTIQSNYYEIRGPEVSINVGDISKVYDGTNEARATDCWIADNGKVIIGDDVKVSIKEDSDAIVGCDSKYAGKHAITSFNRDDFELIGNDAHKYSIGNVIVGTINITPANLNIACGEFTAFQGDPSVNLNTLLSLPEETWAYAKPTFSVRDQSTTYEDVGTLTYEENKGMTYSRYDDEQISESGHELVPSSYAAKLQEAKVEFKLVSITGNNPDVVGIDINGDGTPEYSEYYPYWDEYITGHLVLKAESFKNCSVSINEPDKGEIVSDNGQKVDNVRMFYNAAGDNYSAQVVNDQLSHTYALRILDQKGVSTYLNYSIKEDYSSYVFSKWTITKNGEEVPFVMIDGQEFSQTVNFKGEEVSFKCYIVENGVPSLEWQVTSSYDPNTKLEHVGQEIKVWVNIKNTGNCPVVFQYAWFRSSGVPQYQALEDIPVGKIINPEDTFYEEPHLYTFAVSDQDMLNGIGEIIGEANVKRSPDEPSPYYWSDYTEPWEGMTYNIEPINPTIDVEVTPDPVHVVINAETTINYTVKVTNNSNVNFGTVAIFSSLLGIQDLGIATYLSRGQSITLNVEDFPQLKLSSINETMISNNEIRNEVTAMARISGDTSGGKLARGSGYGLTTVEKEKVQKPTARDLTYNSEEQVGVEFNEAGVDPVSGFSAVEAGTYTASFKLKAWYEWEDDPTSSYCTVTYTIKPATLNVKLTPEDYTQPYNGKAYSKNFSESIDPEQYYGDDQRITDAVFTTKGVNKGTYNLSQLDITYTDVPNYILSIDEESAVAISAKDFNDQTITITTSNLIYNGNEQTTNYQIWDKTLGNNPTLLVEGTDYEVIGGISATNANEEPKAAYFVKVKGIGNYVNSELTQPDGWRISKASLTVVITGNSNSVVYSGNEQSLSFDEGKGGKVEFSSNPQGLTKEVVGAIAPDPYALVAKGTDFGTYSMFNDEDGQPIIFSLSEQADNINATFLTNAGILSITKKNIEDEDVAISGDTPLIYNGGVSNPNISVTYNGDALIKDVEYSIQGDSEHDVGKYTATISAKGNNFTGTKVFNWEIVKKDYEITHEPFNKTYDATFLTSEFTNKPFEDSEDAIKVTVKTSSDEVGVYPNLISPDHQLNVNIVPANETTNLGNYNFDYSSLSASISKRALKVIPKSRQFEYDGNEHGLISNEIFYADPDDESKEGLLTNHYVDVNKGGVTWSANNKALEVTDEPIVVNVEKIRITSATIYGDANDVTKNYDIDYNTTANLEVYPLTIYVNVVGKNAGCDGLDIIQYDGKEKSVSGYEVAEAPDITTGKLTNKFDANKLYPQPNDCVAKGTDPGNYELQYEGEVLSSDKFNYNDKNINCIVTYTTGKLVISKKNLGIRVNAAKNWDGTALVHKLQMSETDGLAEGETFDEETSTITTNSGDIGTYDQEGTSGKTFTISVDWNNPDWADHYVFDSYIRLTIQEKLVITVNGTRSNSGQTNIYYDGEVHKVTGYTFEGTKSTFDPTKFGMKPASKGKDIAEGINAGTYFMGLTANDFYYNDPSEIDVEIIVNDGYVKILPKELENEMLDWKYKNQFTYNGQTQGPDFVIKNGGSVLLTGRDYYVNNGSAVNVDTYWAEIHGKGNYTGTINNIPWEIIRANVDFEIKGNTSVQQYDGKTHSVEGFTYTVKQTELAPFVNKNNNIQLQEGKGKITKTSAGEYVMNLLPENFTYVDDGNITPKFHVEDGWLKIEKRKLSDVNIYLDPNSFTYDGFDKQPTIVINDFGQALPLNLFNITGQTVAKDAGSYSITVDAYKDDSNYDGKVTLPWTINKRYMEVNVSGNTSTTEYNGKEQQVAGYTAQEVTTTEMFQFSKVKLLSGTSALAKGTNAGMYYMNLVASDFDYDDKNLNVKFNVVNDGCLEITPIDINSIDLTVNPLNFVYNGKYQSPDINASSSAGNLTEDVDYVKTGAKAKNVGAYKLVITGVGNYTGKAEFNWSISKADVAVIIKGNTATDVDYDGSLHTLSGYKFEASKGKDLIDSGVVEITPDSDTVYVQGVNAGEYYMNLYDKQFKTDNNNVNFTYTIANDGLLKINPIDINYCNFDIIDKVYNGHAQDVGLQVVYNNNSLTNGKDYILSGDISAANVKVEGNYTVTITGAGNFTNTTNQNWNILAAPINVKVNAKTEVFTYDGNNHEASGFDSASYSDFFNKSKVSGPATPISVTGTDAGSYESTGSYVANSFKYNDTNINATFEVDKAKVKLVINKAELQVMAHKAKFADGTALESEATLNGLIGEDIATATVTTKNSAPYIYKNFGEDFDSTFDFTTGNLDNYNVSYDVELIISENPTAEDKTIVIYANLKSSTYNGQEQSASWSFISIGSWEGFNPANVQLQDGVSVPVAKGTNAGTYMFGLTNKDFVYKESVDNLTIVYYDGGLTITPKQITTKMVTSVAPTSFIYNKKAQGPNVILKDNNDQKILNTDEYELENGSAINAGVYNLVIKGRGNYTGEVSDYLWAIKKAEVNINIDRNKTFDNSILRVSLTENDIEGLCKGDELTCDLTTQSANPGVYTVNGEEGSKLFCKIEGENIKNYNIHTNAVLRIDKRALNVTPTSRSFEFDGQEHKLLDDELVIEGLLAVHNISDITWNNNSQTDVGTKNNVIVQSLTVNKKVSLEESEDVSSFYNINYYPASLTVTPGKIAIYIKGNTATYAYDGKSHKVEGYEAWELPYAQTTSTTITGAFDPDKLIALNDCVAVGVDPGRYPMGQRPNNFIYDDKNFDPSAIRLSYSDGVLDITKNTFDSAVVDVRNLTYNGQEQTTSLVVNMYDSDGHPTTLKQGTALDPDSDYEIVNSEDSTLTGKDAKTYSVTIKGLHKYQGASKTVSWVIKKADVEISIIGIDASKPYTGADVIFPDPVKEEKAFTAVETSATGLFSEVLISFKEGYVPQVKGTALGKYMMGINVAMFMYADANNINAHFTLVKDARLEITPADISGDEFKGSASSFVYNGAVQTTNVKLKQNDKDLVYGVDYKIRVKTDEGDIVSITSAQNVGEYPIQVEGIGNYKGIKANISWNITPAPLTIKVTGNKLVTEYTGYEQAVSGLKSEAVDGAITLFNPENVILCSGKPAVAKGTEAGEYITDINYSDSAKDLAYTDTNINATFEGDIAQTGVITQVKLVINKKILQINAMDVKTYDGKKLVHAITTKDVDGAVSGQVVSGTVETTSGEPGTYNTETKLNLEIKVDGKPESSTSRLFAAFKNDPEPDPRDNYEIRNSSSLTITADESQYIIVKGNQESYEYNGKEQKLENNPFTFSTNIDNFDPEKLHISGITTASGTNAGEYTTQIQAITYEDGTPNISWTDAKLIITKRSINEAVVGDFTNKFYYNATGQQPNLDRIKITDFEGSKTLTEGTDFQYVAPKIDDSVIPGSYSVKINADAIPSGNYKGILETSYSILKAKRTVNIIGNKGSVSYDGQTHSVVGYTFKEVVPEEQTGNLISSSNIIPAFENCIVEASETGTYPMGLDASEFEYVGTDAAYVDVNFVIEADGQLDITTGDASSWRVKVNNTEFTYNGKAQGPRIEWVKDADGNEIDAKYYDVTGNSEVNVGENYTLTITAKGRYSGAKEIPWKIVQAKRTVKIFGEQSLNNTYNGKKQSVYGYTAEEVIPEGNEAIVDFDYITPGKDNVVVSGTDAGTYRGDLKDSTFKYNDDNIDVTFLIEQDSMLVINKCNLYAVAHNFNPTYVTYDGTEHKVNNPDTTKSDPRLSLYINNEIPLILDKDYTITGDESGTDVGTYSITIDSVNPGNFTGSISLKWYISPAEVNMYVVGDQVVKVYDGQLGGAEGYEIDGKPDFITDEQIMFSHNGEVVPSVTGTNVNVYKYGMLASDFTCTNQNVNAHFHIQNDVMLTITTKNIADVDITKEMQDFTYCGTTLTSQAMLNYVNDHVNMPLYEGTDYIIKNNTGLNANTYYATIEGKGNYSGVVEMPWEIAKFVANVTVDGAQGTFEYKKGTTWTVTGYTVSISSESGDANNIVNPNLITPGKANFRLSREEVGNDERSLSDVYGSTVNWGYAQEDENIVLTINEGQSMKISVNNVDITRHEIDVRYTREHIYDGNAWSPITASGSEAISVYMDGAPLSNINYEFIGGAPETNVPENGSYSFGIRGKEDQGYIGEIHDYLWRIVPREIDFTPEIEGKTFDYDPIREEKDISTDVGEEEFTAIFTSKTIKENVVSAGINAGTYVYPKEDSNPNYFELSINPKGTTLARNYHIVTEPVSVEITKANYFYAWSSTLTYNGKPQTSTFSVQGPQEMMLYEGVDFTVAPESKTATDAGTYTAYVTNINPNYAISDPFTIDWKIEKASLPTFTYSETLDYNGSVVERTKDYATGINNEKFDISFATDGADAGTYTTVDGITNIAVNEKSHVSAKADNYKISTGEYTTNITIKINQKQIDPEDDDDIEIYVENPENLVYNAEEQTPTIKVKDNGEDIDNTDNKNYTITYSSPSAIDADDYTFTVTAVTTGNYIGSYTGTWTILPASVTYNFESSWQYDGSRNSSTTTLNSETVTVTGQIFGSDSFDLTSVALYNGQPTTDVGEYYYPGSVTQNKASIELTENSGSLKSNYLFTITTHLSITTNDISSMYELDEYTNSYIYNGYDQFPTDIKVVKKGDRSVELPKTEYTIVGNKYKNVGENYGFHIEAKEGSNLTGSIYASTSPDTDFTWAITPANVSYNFNDSRTYNGQNYSKQVHLTSANGLLVDDTIDVTFAAFKEGSPTGDAGNYLFENETLSGSYSNSNYTLTFSGQVIINGKSIKGQEIDIEYTHDLEYNAGEQSPTDLADFKVKDTTLGQELSLTDDYVVTSSKQTDVPESGVYTFTIQGAGNYVDSISKEWSIIPHNVEVKDLTDTKTYNGQNQSLVKTLTSSDGLYGSDQIKLTFTTTGPNVGKYEYPSSGLKSLTLSKERVEGTASVLRDYTFDVSNVWVLINPQELSGEFSVQGVNDLDYNGYNQTLNLTIEKSDGSIVLTPLDYDVIGSISEKDVPDPKVSDHYEFHIKGKGNFSGEIWNGSPNVPFTWKVKPASVTYNYVDPQSPLTYNAEKYENDVVIGEGTLFSTDEIGLNVVSDSKNVGTYSFPTTNADGNLIPTLSEINTPLRNYDLTLTGSIVINKKQINPEDIIPVCPDYNGDEQSPVIVIKDKDTGEALISGDDYTLSGITEATDVAATDMIINATLDPGANYSGIIPAIPWNIRPKAITIKITEEKVFDGKTIIVEGTLPTGVYEQSFDYSYETEDSAVGVYSREKGNLIGGYEPTDEETKVTNYAVNEDVVLTINGVPPEPSPDVPEYVPGQTGDALPYAVIGVLALTLIGAFLFLRRSKKVQGLHIR